MGIGFFAGADRAALCNVGPLVAAIFDSQLYFAAAVSVYLSKAVLYVFHAALDLGGQGHEFDRGPSGNIEHGPLFFDRIFRGKPPNANGHAPCNG